MITKTTTSIILFGLIAVIGFGNAYAETPDRVTVDSFPFEITIEEGGELTFIDNDYLHHLYHPFGNEEAFEYTVPIGDRMVITLPEWMTEDNSPEGYVIHDRQQNQYNMIFVKAPHVEPTPEVVVTSTGINNVATYEGDVDALALQKALAEVTASFNNSVEKIAEQKSEIELLNANLVVAVDTTSLDSTISELRANNTALANDITVITADRDEWKALAENWYGVAMAQLKVMVNLLGL